MGYTSSDAPFGLAIRSIDSQDTIRRIVWDKDWRIPADALDGPSLPRNLTTAKGYGLRRLAAMKQVTAADVAIGEGWDDAKPDAVVWDAAHAKWHDLRASLGETEDVYVATFTGQQLQDVVKSLQAKPATEPPGPRGRGGRPHLLPELTADQIVPEATYRVAFSRGAGGSVLRSLAPLLTDARAVRVDFYEELRRVASQEQQP